jgi:hypothetical protein
MPEGSQNWVPKITPTAEAVLSDQVRLRFRSGYDVVGECWIWRGARVWSLNGSDMDPRAFAIEIYGSPTRRTVCHSPACIHPGHREPQGIAGIRKRKATSPGLNLNTQIDDEIFHWITARATDMNVTKRAFLEAVLRAEMGSE